MGAGGKCLNVDLQHLQNREVCFQILDGYECEGGNVGGQCLVSFLWTP